MGELEKGGEGLGAEALVSAIGHDHHGFLVGDGMMFLRPVELDLMGRPVRCQRRPSNCLGPTSAGTSPGAGRHRASVSVGAHEASCRRATATFTIHGVAAPIPRWLHGGCGRQGQRGAGGGVTESVDQ
jgi:hypothetical protein